LTTKKFEKKGNVQKTLTITLFDFVAFGCHILLFDFAAFGHCISLFAFATFGHHVVL
jgi:hypothetical protein